MNINKNNYEAFFLDYHEGNLSPQQVADLLLFIEQNPEHREEFESFENITLEDLSAVTFENKSGLKKEITVENKDEFFIRSVENTLTPLERTLVNDFIKQHPQYSTDFELFQKTKLKPDNSIVFENKESLKHAALTTDDLLIASVEGLLTSSETALLNQQIAVDLEMQHSLHLYKQTKLVADTSIIFEEKEGLKRKERRAIPLFYYVAVAASLLFLFGLYFMFSNHSDESKMANVTPEQKISPKKNQESSIGNQENLAAVSKSDNAIVKNSTRKKQEDPFNKKDSPVAPVTNNELPIANNNQPLNNEQPIANNELPVIKNEQTPTINNQQPVTNNQSLALINKTNSSSDFLTFREMAVEKLKEKTLDDNTIASQKKNGRLKRFSGWDLAQLVSKGVSKLTGRDLEVKPTYNDDGNVTAYALGNGIERSIGR